MIPTKKKPLREKLDYDERRRRLSASNEALVYFAAGTRIVEECGYVSVFFKPGKFEYKRRWQTRSGSSFFPIWSQKWGQGGTACTALSQLVRWVQGHPILPLSTWRYWCSAKIGMAGEHGLRLVETLASAGYPRVALCVLCGEPILDGLDWWNLRGVSGPACTYKRGCRQVIDPEPADHKSAAVKN